MAAREATWQRAGLDAKSLGKELVATELQRLGPVATIDDVEAPRLGPERDRDDEVVRACLDGRGGRSNPGETSSSSLAIGVA